MSGHGEVVSVQPLWQLCYLFEFVRRLLLQVPLLASRHPHSHTGQPVVLPKLFLFKKLVLALVILYFIRFSSHSGVNFIVDVLNILLVNTEHSVSLVNEQN